MNIYFFIFVSGKLDISVQCSKKLPSGRRSINKQRRSVLLQDFDDVHSEKINTLVNPVKTDFDDDSKKQTDKRDCDGEMLADGKLLEKQKGEGTVHYSFDNLR